MSDTAPSMSDWGWVTDDELARVVLISPHPDDAVLSCGRFLAAHPGVDVITVFAGIPTTYPDPPGRWTVLSGFGAGDDIVSARRAEDADALGFLAARPQWLDFVEGYLSPDDPAPTADDLAAVLTEHLERLRPTLVLVPMGLANPEHVRTHDAALLVRAAWTDRDAGPPPAWCCYEDIAYKHIPGQLAWRVAKLFRAAVWPTPVAMPLDPTDERKREAMARYPSQVRALDADWQLWPRLDAPTPEQYWRLEPPPPGWEAMIDLV
jgi:LmbE family N-acetylglucosaminyl deacetylase